MYRRKQIYLELILMYEQKFPINYLDEDIV